MTARALGVLAGLCALHGCGPRATEAPAGAPNVLLVSIDTLRADHLGFDGYERPTSPDLDEFASGAAVFEAAESTTAWTLPSLASILTGESCSTHGCWDYTSVLDDSFRTLPEILLAAGYDTACAASHVFVTTRHGLQQGIVHTDDSYAFPEVEPEDSITSQAIADRGIRFLAQKAAAPERGPWFLWLHFFDPHATYVEHAGITGLFETPGQRTAHEVMRDAYDGEIRYTDQHLGRLFEALERTGFAANTVVVLVADHGEEFWEHGAHGHGHSLHREVVRVPLVIRAPGFAARRVTEVVSQVDLLPTVMELVGLEPPAGTPGRSLVPALRGEPLAPVAALAELDLNANTLDSLRRGDLRLLHWPRTGETVVYDLACDPLESDEARVEDPDVVRELTEELERAKALARERARLFRPAGEIAFTPGQAEDLSDLGYGEAR